jgi:hypothetical protein
MEVMRDIPPRRRILPIMSGLICFLQRKKKKKTYIVPSSVLTPVLLWLSISAVFLALGVSFVGGSGDSEEWEVVGVG